MVPKSKKAPKFLWRPLNLCNLIESETSAHVDCIAFFQRHIGFLNVPTGAKLAAETLDLAFGDGCIHGLHLYTEQGLNCLLDGWLVGVDCHFENHGVVLRRCCGFFGDDVSTLSFPTTKESI